MFLTKYSINNRISAGIIFIALCIIGFIGYLSLPINFLPEITYPYIMVRIGLDGASPDEIERNIAMYIEREIATVDGIVSFESRSSRDSYFLNIEFDFSVSPDTAFQDVSAVIARAKRRLPDEASEPLIMKRRPSNLPFAKLVLFGDNIDFIKLRDWADNWFTEQLLTVKGLAGASVGGGLEREIRISLDISALEKYKISISEVINKIAKENKEQYAGYIETEKTEYVIRTIGDYKSVDEIANIVISSNGNTKVHLKDIAEVLDYHKKVSVYSRFNGKNCVTLALYDQPDSNIVEITENLQKRLKELKSAFIKGVEVRLIDTQAPYIKKSVSDIFNTAYETIGILAVVIFLFLGSFRQVLIMCCAVPIAMLINFGIMYLLNFSLNIFSLGGLVISIGCIVDDSIVVLENITRYKINHPHISLKDMVDIAASEVAPAVVGSTVAFIALFLPFILVSNTITLLFRELVFVIAFMVTISTFVAVTIVPILSTLFLGKSKKADVKGRNLKKTKFDKFFEKISVKYQSIVNYTIDKKLIITLFMLGLFILSIIALGKLSSEFIPKLDDGRIGINIRLPVGTKSYETSEVVLQVEKLLLKEIDNGIVDYFSSESGGRVRLTVDRTSHIGNIDVQLVEWAKRKITTDEYTKLLNEKLKRIKLNNAMISARQMGIRGVPRLSEENNLELEVKGIDMNVLNSISEKIKKELSSIDSIKNINTSIDFDQPEYQIVLDRTRLSDLGISASDISDTLYTFVGGKVASKFRDNDRYYDIKVVVDEQKLPSINAVNNLIIHKKDGKYVRLYEIAKIKQAYTPANIERKNQVKQIKVTGSIQGEGYSNAISKVNQILENLRAKGDIPTGYLVEFGGEALQLKRMTNMIIGLFIFAVFLSFVILTVQFNSLLNSLLILFTMPFCFIGMIFMLFFANVNIGSTVIIGMLLIVYATANDGVLLVSTAEMLRKEKGLSPKDAIVTAATIRLRPRVMTTITTIIGLVPLALKLGQGGDLLQPMAIAAIGGLIFEIFVTLFFMPAVYEVITNRIKKDLI